MALKKTAKKSAKKTAKKSRSLNQNQTAQQSGPLIRSFIAPKQTGPAPLRILWIPGLGGDRAMFAKIIDHINDNCLHPIRHSFLEYPNVGVGEVDSLESLASLLSQAILPDEPYDMAIGYSMGGMLLQILRMKGALRAERCVLIASGYSGQDTTAFLGRLASLPKPPMFLRRMIQKTTARLYPILRMNIDDSKEYGAMLGRSCKTIFFEGGNWVRKWQGVPEPFYSDCLSIHGTNDSMMSYT
ncbi:MAG: alpha/beta hydrolase, partial [Leptonema sp. (in: Bacteria)]|nr:alpha/beta hydrolase [Leptonema sp. (in: bacteria)]